MDATNAPTAAEKPPEIPTVYLTLGVGALVAFTLWTWGGAKVAGALGDTDDALRLVLVRDLLSGRAGWWDQHFARLQPPLGMDLHWSRLVDGGIAAVERGLGLFMDPAHAELAARTVWPFLWLFPVIAAALSIARSLRGPVAAFLCAALMLVNLPLFAQWAPGRIDHHDVQIALCLVALAGVVRGGRGGSALAGAATGLGLAVGIEGLIFEALIGAAVAVRFLIDPLAERRAARAYALGLAFSLLPLFLIETPPARWGVSVCDTIGLNLAAGVAVACAGLVAATALTARRGLGVRAGSVGLVGLAAGATYLGLLPACLHGPLAQADPRLWPVWLSHISEMRSLFLGFPDLGNGFAISEIVFHVVAAAAWLWLGRRPEQRTIAWGLLGACLAAGVAAETQAQRMSFYTSWFATPIVAAAVVQLGAVWFRRRLVPMVIIAVAASPTWASAAIAALHPTAKDAINGDRDQSGCTAPADYRRLAALPTGLVLSEVDLGPYVLATTPHAVIAAPYHRMAWGILSARAALDARPDAAAPAVRRLHATYVVACPRRNRDRPHNPWPATSLQAALERDTPPAWLQPMSPPAEPLQVYLVKPSGP